MERETFDIEIPFGAHDSEMMGWECTIPAGYTAEIKDGKVIIKKNKYTDEQLSQAVHNCLEELEEVHGWNYVYVDGESIPISKIKEWNKDGRKKQRVTDTEEEKERIRQNGRLDVCYNPEKYGLCHKTEWGEGEMEMLDSMIDDYEKTAKSFCGYDGKIAFLKAIRDGEYGLSKQEWDEEDNIIKNVISYLNGEYGFKSGDDEDAYRKGLVKQLKSLRPQPKVEWNENDEFVFDAACNALEVHGHHKLSKMLKSIRPRPHWKPSAEQMEYLAKAIDTLSNEGDCKTAYHLIEIRKGLKKLI